MNILIPDSWLREFLDTKATPLEIQEYLSLCGPSVEKIDKSGNDFIYHTEITTNRIDCVSVEGIAREAAAILPRFNIDAQYNEKQLPEIKGNGRLPLSIEDPEKFCPRLLGIVMDGVYINYSDNLISDRLTKCGIRSLNNAVDITNYVMLELGHPCHVFDYDRVYTGRLLFRPAKKGESLVTLDGKKYSLDPQDVVIDDGNGRIIDLPGIMGCENSVVTDKTKRVIVFIESNDPVKIRKTSQRLGIRTMAASINEKNPDSITAYKTFLKAVSMFEKYTKGKPASELIDIYPKKEKLMPFTTNIKYITDRIGIDIKKKEIVSILRSLKFTVKTAADDINVTAPYFRANDVKKPHDLVEETARLYGYHKLPGNSLSGRIPYTSYPRQLSLVKTIKTNLKYWGFTENYHYSLISENLIKKVKLNPLDHLKLSNPLTQDMSYLRISLLPSIINSVAENESFTDNLQLFEIANIYIGRKNDLPLEKEMLVLAIQKGFFHLKGIVLGLFDELGISDTEEVKGFTSGFFHPKKTLTFNINGFTAAKIGEIHPSLQQNFGLSKKLYLAELDLGLISASASFKTVFKGIPKFPSVIEKITFMINPQLNLGHLLSDISKLSSEIIKIRPVDKYEKWQTLEIHYRSRDKNLEQKDVLRLREKVFDLIEKNYKLAIKK